MKNIILVLWKVKMLYSIAISKQLISIYKKPMLFDSGTFDSLLGDSNYVKRNFIS